MKQTVRRVRKIMAVAISLKESLLLMSTQQKFAAGEIYLLSKNTLM